MRFEEKGLRPAQVTEKSRRDDSMVEETTILLFPARKQVLIQKVDKVRA